MRISKAPQTNKLMCHDRFEMEDTMTDTACGILNRAKRVAWNYVFLKSIAQ